MNNTNKLEPIFSMGCSVQNDYCIECRKKCTDDNINCIYENEWFSKNESEEIKLEYLNFDKGGNISIVYSVRKKANKKRHN